MAVTLTVGSGPLYVAILAVVSKRNCLPVYSIRHFLYVQFIPSLESNIQVCPAVVRQNTAENGRINSHAQDTTALQTSVLLRDRRLPQQVD